MKLADKILEVEKDYKQFKLVTLGNYLPFKKIGNLVYVSGQLPIKDEKIILLKIVSNIVKTGMNVIGVDTPEKM